MAKATLERPNFIEEPYPESGAERQTAYLFVKTFIKEDGSTYRHYESVTVQKEGNEVSFSSHYIRENQLKEKLKAGRILYNATSLDASRKAPLENPTHTNSGAPSVRKDTP
ncbi:MAG: hypothetical protein IKH19_06835 [Muribaculaceae bacterium]|nr:hypothetical protein [Muribaculaceae bacterium]MBR4602307.1 hypothetical protein [Prevotella sp.]